MYKGHLTIEGAVNKVLEVLWCGPCGHREGDRKAPGVGKEWVLRMEKSVFEASPSSLP